MTISILSGSKNISQNKYFNWYCKIIKSKKSLSRTKHNDIYYENHHILPKSMGGIDSFDNTVLLTPKEHFICHLLLEKFTLYKDHDYMSHAIANMSFYKKYNRDKMTSKMYEKIRINYMILQKNRMCNLINNGNFKSPFLNPETHKKTMKSREKNGSNIFITNNPMFNKETIKKKVDKTSGKNHYYRKKYKYYFKNINDLFWTEIKIENNLQETLNNLNWNSGTFYQILKTKKIRKKGNMKNILLKREINENFINKKD